MTQSDGEKKSKDARSTVKPWEEQHHAVNSESSDQFGTTRTMSGAMADQTWRCKAKKALESHTFEQIMGKVVVANIILMVFETNAQAGCDVADCSEVWHQVINYLFQVVYTIEVLVSIFVFRSKLCASKWRVLDCVVVFTGYVDIILSLALDGKETLPGPSLSLLRIFRIVRLLRIARILRFFPELYSMISGFVGAMMAMFWGMFMIMVLLLIWSIIAVETIGPVNRDLDWGDNEYCQNTFSSIQGCMLMFFQTVFAGDSWGNCAVPIIRAHPWSFIIFAGTLITIQLGFTNLVLAVIVERATKAQADDTQSVLKERRQWHEKALKQLQRLIQKIDKDHSGSLSWEELNAGYDENEELSELLELMDIEKKDLRVMFDYLADGESREADYKEFVESLYRCECDDPRRQMMMMSLQVGSILRTLNKEKRMARGSKATIGTVRIQAPSAGRDSKATLNKMVVPPTLQEHEDLRFPQSLQMLRDALDAQFDDLSKRFNNQSAILDHHTNLLSSMVNSTPVSPVKSKKVKGSVAAVGGRKDDVVGKAPATPPLEEEPGNLEVATQPRGMEGTSATAPKGKKKAVGKQ